MCICCPRSARDQAPVPALCSCLQCRTVPEADMNQVTPVSASCWKWLGQNNLKIPKDAKMCRSRLYQAVTYSLFGCDTSL